MSERCTSKVSEKSYILFLEQNIELFWKATDVFTVFVRCGYKLKILLAAGKNVWEDIDPTSTSFIKNYLTQYPEVCCVTCRCVGTLYRCAFQAVLQRLASKTEKKEKLRSLISFQRCKLPLLEHCLKRHCTVQLPVVVGQSAWNSKCVVFALCCVFLSLCLFSAFIHSSVPLFLPFKSPTIQ